MQERSWCERITTAHINAVADTQESIKNNPVAAITTTGFGGLVGASFLTTPQNSCSEMENCTLGTAIVGFASAGAIGLVITGSLYTGYFAKEIINPTRER